MAAAAPNPVHAAPPRIAFVSGYALTLLASRGPLIRRLVASNSPVLCVAPFFSAEQESRIAFMGAEQAVFDLVPANPPVFLDWRAVRALAATLRTWSPDVVVGMSERVMALAMLAARHARVPRRVALFNGFDAEHRIGTDRRNPMLASPRLMARAFRAADTIVFHNRDDRRELERANALAGARDVRVLPGAGVDLTAFAAMPLPPASGGVVFLMIATLDRGRGVIDYCEAAQRLKARAPAAQFLLAGPAGEGASGLRAEMLRPYADAVTFLGPLADVRQALAEAHVFVYPSHAEGMPRAVIEALAIGRPVITTATPGCRDTVDDCVNGCLVGAGDVAGLETAMTSLLKRPDLLASMARASRSKAERHFDERQVLSSWMEILGIGSRQGAAHAA